MKQQKKENRTTSVENTFFFLLDSFASFGGLREKGGYKRGWLVRGEERWGMLLLNPHFMLVTILKRAKQSTSHSCGSCMTTSGIYAWCLLSNNWY